VKTTQDQLKAGGGSTSVGDPYNTYIALLKSVAIGYDKKHGKFAKAKIRQVYQAQLGSDGDINNHEQYDDAIQYDIDTPVSDLMQVNRTNMKASCQRRYTMRLVRMIDRNGSSSARRHVRLSSLPFLRMMGREIRIVGMINDLRNGNTINGSTSQSGILI